MRDVGLYAHRAQHAILFLFVYVQILHDNAIKRNHLEILKKNGSKNRYSWLWCSLDTACFKYLYVLFMSCLCVDLWYRLRSPRLGYNIYPDREIVSMEDGDYWNARV